MRKTEGFVGHWQILCVIQLFCASIPETLNVSLALCDTDLLFLFGFSYFKTTLHNVAVANGAMRGKLRYVCKSPDEPTEDVAAKASESVYLASGSRMYPAMTAEAFHTMWQTEAASPAQQEDPVVWVCLGRTWAQRPRGSA